MDTVSNLEESLSANGPDDTLAAIAVIFALCLSGYLMLVMMRSLWRRYENHLDVLTDRVVRKHFSQMYSLMVERVLCSGVWGTDDQPPPTVGPWGSPMHRRCTPPCTPGDRFKELTVIVENPPRTPPPARGDWFNTAIHGLDVLDMEIRNELELRSVMDDCNRGLGGKTAAPERTREIGGRMWFMRRRTVEHVVGMSVQSVYREYQSKLTGQFLIWIQKYRMNIRPSAES